jgi:hypothetical protein
MGGKGAGQQARGVERGILVAGSVFTDDKKGG